jgi:endonuclease I
VTIFEAYCYRYFNQIPFADAHLRHAVVKDAGLGKLLRIAHYMNASQEFKLSDAMWNIYMQAWNRAWPVFREIAVQKQLFETFDNEL